MLAVGLMLLSGCPREETAPRLPEDTQPRPSVALHVVVVNAPELAETLQRLRGEWHERSGSELSATTISWQDVAEQPAVEADLIIFPSRYLGELGARGWLRPVRANVLQSPDVDQDDLFPLARRELIRWGSAEMALPLGVGASVAQPAAIGRPAIVLLAEAAPQAVSEDRLGVLFDVESMQPRITEPPFRESLARLVEAGDDRRSFTSNGPPQVPVLGYDDRLVAVTTTTRNAATAFRLAGWLASAEISTQLALAGDDTLPARRSLADSPAWHDAQLTLPQRVKLGEALRDALSQPSCLLVPRIPGIDQYLAALDDAVDRAAGGEVEPAGALQAAADRWEQITEAHGRDSQQRAYLKHLGISDP